MGGGSGGRINKPKNALCKKNLRKEKKMKGKIFKQLKVLGGRSEATLKDTTEEILKQCRSNPKANIHLSGKKKRALMKEAKRLARQKEEMDCGIGVKECADVTKQMETS